MYESHIFPARWLWLRNPLEGLGNLWQILFNNNIQYSGSQKDILGQKWIFQAKDYFSTVTNKITDHS